jgi:phenylpyruvate tautomerase PptA (4-oxalocrotonate tautomerase family)
MRVPHPRDERTKTSIEGLREPMATYTIQIPGGQLSGERKTALPEAIKDAHAKTTGAPRDLTQVTVLEISSACFWLHGTPLECRQIFVHGFVAGDAEHSYGPALRDAVASAGASATDFELGSVVVTISEVPTDKMRPAGSPNR